MGIVDAPSELLNGDPLLCHQTVAQDLSLSFFHSDTFKVPYTDDIILSGENVLSYKRQ